jgi:hypothetical protein
VPKLKAPSVIGIDTDEPIKDDFACAVGIVSALHTNHQSPITNHHQSSTSITNHRHRSPIIDHQSSITNHRSPIIQSSITLSSSPKGLTWHIIRTFLKKVLGQRGQKNRGGEDDKEG